MLTNFFIAVSIFCVPIIGWAAYPIETTIGKSPKRVRCSLLVDGITLESKIGECGFYKDSPTSCSAELAFGPLKARYFFNSQRGAIGLDDQISGVSVYVPWDSIQASETGYKMVSAELHLKNGGLLGDPKLRRVEVKCYASADDWK
jgi:hypothetical protein